MPALLFEGILLGLTLAVLVGPAFFALLQTSIHRGFKAGLFMAMGIFISDFTLVVITYLGLTQFIDFEHNDLFFGIIGGAILIIFGTVTYTRKPMDYNPENQHNGENSSAPSVLTQFVKGYFLNLLNPFLIIWWMTIVINISANFSEDKAAIYTFFSGTLLTILITDILKVYVAGKIKSLLNPKLIHWINRIVGLLLVLFGLILIFRVVYMYR